MMSKMWAAVADKRRAEAASAFRELLKATGAENLCQVMSLFMQFDIMDPSVSATGGDRFSV